MKSTPSIEANVWKSACCLAEGDLVVLLVADRMHVREARVRREPDDNHVPGDRWRLSVARICQPSPSCQTHTAPVSPSSKASGLPGISARMAHCGPLRLQAGIAKRLHLRHRPPDLRSTSGDGRRRGLACPWPRWIAGLTAGSISWSSRSRLPLEPARRDTRAVLPRGSVPG